IDDGEQNEGPRAPQRSAQTRLITIGGFIGERSNLTPRSKEQDGERWERRLHEEDEREVVPPAGRRGTAVKVGRPLLRVLKRVGEAKEVRFGKQAPIAGRADRGRDGVMATKNLFPRFTKAIHTGFHARERGITKPVIAPKHRCSDRDMYAENRD